ncbi:hypothetical protein [Flavobacterium bernardetii]|nr:hypothetical protein [Flavobacterium bernardetii]
MESKHMLEWFSDEPFEDITSSVEAIFKRQAPNTKMLSFEITSDPQWLTGNRKSKNNDNMILVRSGMAATCNFSLENNNKIHDLKGVLTWVGANLDSNPIRHIWMNLDGTLQEFGDEGMLKERIYYESDL